MKFGALMQLHEEEVMNMSVNIPSRTELFRATSQTESCVLSEKDQSVSEYVGVS